MPLTGFPWSFPVRADRASGRVCASSWMEGPWVKKLQLLGKRLVFPPSALCREVSGAAGLWEMCGPPVAGTVVWDRPCFDPGPHPPKPPLRVTHGVKQLKFLPPVRLERGRRCFSRCSVARWALHVSTYVPEPRTHV